MLRGVDKWFLGIVAALLVSGFFIFLSASLGQHAREGAQFFALIFNQFFALVLGLIALFITAHINYKLLRKYSLLFFAFSLFLMLLLFIDALSFEYGGARRWLSLGPVSFQPSELLKIASVLYFATWLGAMHRRVRDIRYGLIPFVLLTSLIGALLLSQPDTGTFLIIATSLFVMYIANGAPWKHIALSIAGGVVGVVILSLSRFYVWERIMTFINPALDPQGAGYQIQQSLIAIGSGELTGRGFGQGIQKFQYLPEPIADSIFAVFSEEFGFIGSVFLVALFTAFALRGLRIARHAPNHFSRLTALGIVILITGQAFLNIGGILNVFPLTGIPLPFVSHGGSSLVVSLAAVGILLNISKYAR
ncbi:MAG: putative lipid II flippase FtsW [Candidatus Paceibacterota bacterium]